MQRRERQLHLRLAACRVEHCQTGCGFDRVFDERRLPSPRLSAQDQDAALAVPRSVEQHIEHRALVSPTAQNQLPGEPNHRQSLSEPS
jgi:hypothetical protein